MIVVLALIYYGNHDWKPIIFDFLLVFWISFESDTWPTIVSYYYGSNSLLWLQQLTGHQNTHDWLHDRHDMSYQNIQLTLNYY